LLMYTRRLVLLVLFSIAGLAPADEFRFKDRLLRSLADQVPGIPKTFDPQTGRFGTGLWTCQDQHPMYPLAVTGDQAVSISGERVGDWLRYAGCRFAVPPGASLHWPALPHHPYRKDGRAEPGEGRLVICIPFDRDHLRQQVTLKVEP